MSWKKRLLIGLGALYLMFIIITLIMDGYGPEFKSMLKESIISIGYLYLVFIFFRRVRNIRGALMIPKILINLAFIVGFGGSVLRNIIDMIL